MLATSVWTQFRLMARRKSAMITFYVVLAFVLVNYLTNVVTYQGSEILEMVHPMQLLLLSDESGAYSLLFIQLYPLLVVLPAGFSFALDRDVDETVFYLTRVGSKDYYRGKLIAAFSITFLVLTLPLLLEIVLNCLSFPLDATGNLDNWSVYDENYIADVQTYLWSGLFLHPPPISMQRWEHCCSAWCQGFSASLQSRCPPFRSAIRSICFCRPGFCSMVWDCWASCCPL